MTIAEEIPTEMCFVEVFCLTFSSDVKLLNINLSIIKQDEIILFYVLYFISDMHLLLFFICFLCITCPMLFLHAAGRENTVSY